MTTERLLRADFHVHSYHSGYASHLRFLRARDCYSEPEAVYRTAKARGMDLVTITDHDSIDGCLEFLDRHPDADDFFVSEEIECWLPDLPLKVHIGAYDIDERIHREIQPLRANVYEAAAYLRQQRIFFTLNHPFFFLRRQVPLDQYLRKLLPLFPGVETRNGTMLRQHNALVEDMVGERTGTRFVVAVGGSDAHTLAGIGTTYTEAPGGNRQEFLQNVRAGRTKVGGRHGTMVRVAREIYGVVTSYWASLLGAGRQDLRAVHRAVGLGFSVASLPAEFIPLLVAAAAKIGEAHRIAVHRAEWERWAAELANSVGAGLPPSRGSEASRSGETRRSLGGGGQACERGAEPRRHGREDASRELAAS